MSEIFCAVISTVCQKHHKRDNKSFVGTHQSGWNERWNGLEVADGAGVGSKQEVDGEEHDSE